LRKTAMASALSGEKAIFAAGACAVDLAHCGSDMSSMRLAKQAIAFGLSMALGCAEPAPVTPLAEAPAIAVTATVAVANAPPITETSSLTASPEEKAGSAETVDDVTAAAPAPAADGAPAIAATGYQPPFPDRVDLFVPPKRLGGVRLKEGESEDAVELLGFVRVDRPQVVLSINGEVHPIYEGATQFGIEVISIQPPKVVLQRGRQRWQASLEN
jgi:hypothetical protein